MREIFKSLIFRFSRKVEKPKIKHFKRRSDGSSINAIRYSRLSRKMFHECSINQATEHFSSELRVWQNGIIKQMKMVGIGDGNLFFLIFVSPFFLLPISAPKILSLRLMIICVGEKMWRVAGWNKAFYNDGSETFCWYFRVSFYKRGSFYVHVYRLMENTGFGIIIRVRFPIFPFPAALCKFRSI